MKITRASILLVARLAPVKRMVQERPLTTTVMMTGFAMPTKSSVVRMRQRAIT